ncbi:hypothetical protein SDJN02_22979, partial [Cucurbita argyrosperma subsp. argyrosperma]
MIPILEDVSSRINRWFFAAVEAVHKPGFVSTSATAINCVSDLAPLKPRTTVSSCSPLLSHRLCNSFFRNKNNALCQEEGESKHSTNGFSGVSASGFLALYLLQVFLAAHCSPLLIDMFRSKKHSQSHNHHNNDSTQEDGKINELRAALGPLSSRSS